MTASLLSRITFGLWAFEGHRSSDADAPAERPRLVAAVGEAVPHRDADSRPLALLVSREQASRKWGARWLERAGFDVEIIGDEVDAVERCESLEPAVVLAEAHLRGADGRRVFESLLDSCESRGVPVIVLCGNDREVQAALETRAADIVGRPINWRVVARRASTLADSYRALDRLGRTLSKLREVEESARSASEQLERYVRVDALTDLPKRTLFERLTENAIASLPRSRGGVAVLHLDLDRFKAINEAHGREGGDEVLRQVARRLRGCVRSPQFAGWQRPGLATAVVGRFAGAEFALTVSSVQGSEDVARLANAIIDALSAPFKVDDAEVFVSVSVGIAISPDDAEYAERLVQHAERATMEAKRRGGGIAHFYNPSLNLLSERSLEIDRMLRGALEHDQLKLHYQPLVDFKSGRIVAAEALLRWDDPVLGRVPPMDFIPVAEETGLMVPVGSWVLRTACAQLARWIDAGLPAIRMTVNVASCQLQRGNFASVVREVLDEVKLPAGRLELELSERGVLRAEPNIISQLDEIKALGVRLSVDDFGTGQAAIAYLRKFDFDVLKIDRSYVKNLERDDNDVAIASAIVAMAHRLRLAVIAEGVESEAQSEILRGWGCDEFQGFLFSPALPAAEFERLLVDKQSGVIDFDGMRANPSGSSSHDE